MVKKALPYIFLTLLLGLMALEGYTFIILRYTPTAPYLTPSLFLLAGLGVALMGLLLALRAADWSALARYRLPDWGRQLALWLPFLLLSLFLFRRLQAFFTEYPITPDIVPALQYYVQRLLAGETVYAPMPFETWTVIPNYLPLMWMPYIVPELLQIDYRYFPIFLFLLSIAAWAFYLLRQDIPLALLLLSLLSPFYILWQIMEWAPNDLAHNAEFTPVAFYLFLALAVWRKSRTGLIITILFCLLSRIALSFWLPMFFIILWIERGFTYPFRMGLWLLLGIFLIYVLPFVIPDPDSFLDGAAYYDKVASDIWSQPWHARDGMPIVLQEGTSFARYFFERHSDAPLVGLAVAKKVHFWGSLATAVALFGGYWLLRKRLDYAHFSLIALKVYLLMFYLLMHTPFAYLFFLVIFFSFPILWASLDQNKNYDTSMERRISRHHY